MYSRGEKTITNKRKRYTDEELINYLHKFKKEYGRIPSSTDLSRNENYPSGAVYTTRFKRFENALKLAGLKRKSPRRNLISDKKIIEKVKQVYNYYGREFTVSEYEEFVKGKSEFPSYNTILNRIGDFSSVIERLNLETPKKRHGKYTKAFLIKELQRFYKETGKVPISAYFENNKDFPSRKTFSNQFGSFGNALIEAGFDYRGIENFQRKKSLPPNIIQFNKEQVKEYIDNYINKYGEVPYLTDLDKIPNSPTTGDIRRLFGSYENALKEWGYTGKAVNYTDEDLKNHFLSFVKIHGRIPMLKEFNNNSSYPSFWCYQNRFGSWNKAVEFYGFKPNSDGVGFNHCFDNGEIVKSSYEYDISTYLRNRGIKYQRDVLYSKYILNYKGKMNCDYVIENKEKLKFIEVAGFITNNKNKSSIELDYTRRFKQKETILKKSNLDYLVIYPRDLKSKTLDEIFEFLD